MEGTPGSGRRTLGAEKRSLQHTGTLSPSLTALCLDLCLPKEGGEAWAVDGRGLVPSFCWQEAPSRAPAGSQMASPRREPLSGSSG